MVNPAEIFGIDPALGHPERALALSYAKSATRQGLAALFALDAILAKLARTTREPIVAQMRLAWWRDALDTVATAPIAGQPILAALHRAIADGGLDTSNVVAMVDGWEALVTDDLPAHARDRGRLFVAAAQLLGADEAWAAVAGEGWAFADLALTSPDPLRAAAARTAATPLLDRALSLRSGRAGRSLGALVLVARMDLSGRVPGDPRRIARLLRYRVIGR